MKDEKFKVIRFIREFILVIDKELENIPRKDIEIKNKIRVESYNLLEIAYYANTTMKIENKKEALEKAIAKVKIIDFLINLCYDKQIITGKKYTKLGLKMDDIIKYISGWLKAITT